MNGGNKIFFKTHHKSKYLTVRNEAINLSFASVAKVFQ